MYLTWAQEELAGIELGDARLEKRAAVLLDELGKKPSASIPMACGGWGETLAAYRFLGDVVPLGGHSRPPCGLYPSTHGQPSRCFVHPRHHGA